MHKGTRRIDNDASRTHGWTATVYRRAGRSVRLFSDGRHGGHRRAYRAAVAWIKEEWKRLPNVPRLERMATRRRNNRSGTSGVYRWPADGRDVTGAFWGAQWVVKPNNPPQRRKYSVARYGENTAKALARRARRRAIAALRASTSARD